MGKKSPPTPDYRGAAEAQGQASKENIIEQTWANRPDQNTPWGSSSWQQQVVKDPITGEDRVKWIQNERLDPTLQNTLDAEFALQNKRTNQAAQLYDRAGALLNDPFNPYLTGWGEVGDPNTARTGNRGGDVNRGYLNNDQINDLRQKSEDAMYERQTSRLNPQFEQERQRKEAQLTAMGLRPTDAAWQTQMDQFNRGRNDAYEQARLGSIGEGRNEYQTMFSTGLQSQQFGNQARQQNLQNYWTDLLQDNQARQQNYGNQFQNANYQNQLRQAQMAEQMMMRNQPLNEINALIHGQQVQSPQFSGFANSGLAETPNLMGAAQSQYGAAKDAFNAKQMGMQNLFSGLGSMFMPF